MESESNNNNIPTTQSSTIYIGDNNLNYSDDSLDQPITFSDDKDNNNLNNTCNNDDNTFVEYQFHQPDFKSGKESLTVINHDFNNTKTDLNDLDDTISTSPSRRLNSSPIRKIRSKDFNIEDDSDSDDEWKEIDTQLNCGDIYNLKGEKLDYFQHSKDDITNLNTTKVIEKPKKKTKMQKAAKTGVNVGKTVVKVTTGVKFGKDEKEQQLREKYQRAHLASNDSTKQGYTRIDEEEQAKKYGEMDKKFDFLFQNENSNLRKLHNSSNSVITPNDKITDDFMNNDNFDDIFNNEGHDENELNPSIQMMSTKSMLNDSQKIAYAALVKLIIVKLQTDLISIRGTGTVKILKKLSKSHNSFTKWSINIMDALYDHLDIKKKEEINMIETLSCHGVETKDLTKSFNSVISVENHLDEQKDLQIINMDRNDVEESTTLKIDTKWTLICDLFLILLESSVYDARSRTLLLNFANEINITNLEIYQFERRITDSLEIDEAFEILNNNQTWDESDILKEHKKRQRNAKIVKVALATAAGGLVIGLSAGALAPVIGAGLAAGLTTIGIGGTSGFLAGAGGTAIITTSGVMSGMRAGRNAMQNRSGSVKTFEFIPLHNNRRVNLIITVSGWMSGTLDDVRLPFSTVDQVMGDLYSLLWEPDMLTSMGQTIGILANEILTQSIQQILGVTLLTTLMAGLQLPMMLSKIGYLLDNPWNNSLDRAWRSGKVLADTLRRNKLGVRPITLVGFSLGARLIYSCLLSLAKSGDFGIVENVYLFGSPIVIKEDDIALARTAVSGRFVNGYVKQDWILGYLFRATSGGLRSIGGLSPIDSETFNIENFNCSEFVKGHMQYREAMPKLLRHIGWEVLEDQFVEIEQPNPEEEERQRKLLSDFEKAQHSKKKKTWYNKFFGRKHKEWWEMYEEGEKEKEGDGKGKVNDDDNDSKGETSTNNSDDNENINESNDSPDQMFDVAALKKEIENIQIEATKATEKKHKNKHKDPSVDLNNVDKTDEAKKDIEKGKKKDKKLKAKSQKSEPKTPTMETGFHKFHLTPKSEKTINHKDLDYKEVTPDTKTPQLNKKKSLIQLVEPVSSVEFENEKNLKPFRMSSKGHTRSPSIPEISKNAIEARVENNEKGNEEVEKTNLINSLNVIKSPNEYTIQEKLQELKDIDYGEYETPTYEDMKITFDDEVEAIEEGIIEKQHQNAGYGPVTKIDYGDDEEFPHDESKLQFCFD